MAEERRASRRDLFKLIGQNLADALSRQVEKGGPPAPSSASPPATPAAPVPAAEVPLERGCLVVDLALHAIVPGSGKRFRAAGATDVLLLVRVTPEHLAAVGGDCPHCGGPLAFDGKRDAVLCPGGAASFRLDGGLIEGPGYLRLRSHPVHRIGPRVEIDASPA